MTVRVRTVDGVQAFAARPGQTWLELLFEVGLFAPRAVCAGIGACGACRVRFEAAAPEPCAEDRLRFDADELAGGWRLACRHRPLPGQQVQWLGQAPVRFLPAYPAEILAVDVGTTALKWAYALPDHGPFSTPNPQAPVGSDVLARVRYATSRPEGGDVLRAAVLDSIAAMAARGVREVVLAGNTVMLALLLGVSVAGLGAAPYRMPAFGGAVCLSADLPPAYVPPPLAPFVGSDLSAGVIACLAENLPQPFVLVDLGTNGEIVWYEQGKLVVSSVPMGPAVEGVGLRWGRLAGPGVISAVDVGPAGLVPRGRGPWQGISGTGYISLLAALRRIGVVDRDGHFASAPPSPLAWRLRRMVREGGAMRTFPVAGPVELFEADVEEFLKVKAALVAALQTVLERVQERVACVAVAGALGSHVAVEDLVTLGFFPPKWRDRIRVVGNTALRGALLLGTRPQFRSVAEELPHGVHVVDATAEAGFSSRYLGAMHLGEWGRWGYGI